MLTRRTQRHGKEIIIVAYANKKVPKSDQHKHSTDSEAIATYWAIIDRLHAYLQGLKHFYLYTNNWAVTRLKRIRKKSRFARIVLDLASNNFTIHYAPGESNIIVDALSRDTETLRLRALAKGSVTQSYT